MRRRHFLTLSAASLGGVIVYSLDRKEKYSRLSVQPVTADEWKLVCKMGGL
jgi:hypothetical protein